VSFFFVQQLQAALEEAKQAGVDATDVQKLLTRLQDEEKTIAEIKKGQPSLVLSHNGSVVIAVATCVCG
jgi:hypothetical protein